MKTRKAINAAMPVAGVWYSVSALHALLGRQRSESALRHAMLRMERAGLVFSRKAGRCKEWSFRPLSLVPLTQGVKYVTFNDTVQKVVEEFLAAKKSFSAYDITKELRNTIGKYNLDPAETGTVVVGGVAVPRIDHEAVKAVVHNLAMPGYTRVHNGTYWEYSEDAVVTPGGVTPVVPFDGNSTI